MTCLNTMQPCYRAVLNHASTVDANACGANPTGVCLPLFLISEEVSVGLWVLLGLRVYALAWGLCSVSDEDAPGKAVSKSLGVR